MDLDVYKTGGIILTALVATLGIFKLKLIEAIVKKMTDDSKNSKGYSILILFGIVVAIASITLNLPDQELEQQVVAVPEERSELEMQIDAAEQAVDLVAETADQIRENKRRKDSIFVVERNERWVYEIGDWTDDEDAILRTHKKLSSFANLKLFKDRKKYIFIKEDNVSKEELVLALDSLKTQLGNTPITLVDLNKNLTKGKQKIVQRLETFGRRRNKIRMECLMVD